MIESKRFRKKKKTKKYYTTVGLRLRKYSKLYSKFWRNSFNSQFISLNYLLNFDFFCNVVEASLLLTLEYLSKYIVVIQV